MQVFISHIEKDKDLAIDLGAELVRAGFAVWNPYEMIYPGDNWEKETGKALEESEIMVVLVTSASRRSEVVTRHVQFALTSSSSHYQARLVPVVVKLPTKTAIRDVAWVLGHMKPVRVDPAIEGWKKVVKRVQALAEKSYHAAD